MKYKNYYNFELGNRDIYSHNDILGMTVQDLFDNELPLSYQYNTIGIPKDDELINSPNTMQYTNANGKRRWRSSSKTTEDLIEEERQRRAALEAQNQVAQSQLSSIQPQSAPIDNNVQKNIAPSPIDNQPLLNDNTIGAIGNFAGKMVDKFKNRKQQSGGVIADAIDSAVNKEDDLQPQSPITRGIENSNNPNFPIMEKGSENPFDQQTQLDALRIEPTDIPEMEGLSSDKLEETKANIAAQYKQALSRAKRNRAAVYPENGVLDGSVRYNLKDYLRDSLGNLSKSFNVKEKWRNFQDTGFNKEDDLNLREEMKDHYDILINNKTDYSVPMTMKEKLTDSIVQGLFSIFYPAASDVYTDGMTNFSRARNNPNAKLLENMNTLDESTRQALLDLEVNPNERGVYYDANSDIAKKFANSPEVKKFFKNNENSIKQGIKNSQDFNFDLDLKDLVLNPHKVERYGSLQHSKMIDIYYDEKGNKHGKFIDNADYTRRYPDKLKNVPKTYINNHGYNMQEKGNFENYYTVMDIILKETLREKLKRKFGR